MSVTINIDTRGFEKFQSVLRGLGAAAYSFAGGALFREAERIMTAAKRRTPIETGNLRASGHVALPVVGAGGVGVMMGFGGVAGSGNHGGETNKEDVGYAVYVHENLTASHVKTLSKKEAARRGSATGEIGQAKFLENAVNEARRGMDARLAADVRREIERMAKGSG